MVKNNNNVNSSFAIMIVAMSQLGISLATYRPGYYFCISIALILGGYLVRKHLKKNISVPFVFIFFISMFGLFSYIIFMSEYAVKYTAKQTLVIHFFVYINYILYFIVFLTSSLMVDANDEEGVERFLAKVIFIVLLSRLCNILIFNDLQGDNGRYYLGFYLSIFLPLTLYLFFSLKNTISFISLFSCLLISYFCFDIYFHRAIIFILPIVIALYLIFRGGIVSWILLLFITFFLLSYMPILLTKVDASYVYRLNFITSMSFNDGSSLSRISRYVEIVSLLFENPLTFLFGYSLGASETLTKILGAHSALLGFVFDVGVIGLIVYFKFILWPIIKVKSNTDFILLLKTTIFGCLIYSVFYYAPIFPVPEVKLIDFSVLTASIMGVLFSYGTRRSK
ncbi:hypothetical protein SE23_17155 [Vibrio sinaloensis]|uniref:hypothetical protein n=1 Tax=Photobacterium sp. (strain ATCC 43367) TaxID=379097 RepID=UPI00057CE96E|nr:hypothetical protein [Vibrio sinaloensis]KIE19446.1 hypothetical protein SE23_17155 [Vibrio sinaloensis]